MNNVLGEAIQHLSSVERSALCYVGGLEPSIPPQRDNRGLKPHGERKTDNIIP